MKVHAVADDGNVASLTSDIFKAIKPEEVLGENRFQCEVFSEVVLFFCHGLDGARTPIEMPSLTVTLLDTGRPLQTSYFADLQARPIPPSRVGCTAKMRQEEQRLIV